MYAGGVGREGRGDGIYVCGLWYWEGIEGGRGAVNDPWNRVD